jgi:ATP-dependent DNA helicase RecG
MLNDAEIERTLRLGEDSTTGFKAVAGSGYLIDPGDLAKAVAALANSGGGHILLGVEDDGTPTGVGDIRQADALMRQVSSVCQDRIRPAIACRVVKAECRQVVVLVVEVAPFGPARPYLVDGRCHVRDGASSRPATRDEQIRILESVDYHFDEQPIEKASRDDLDDGAIGQFLSLTRRKLQEGETTEPYLRAIRALDASGRPTVAGVLFFAREPTRWLLDARVSAVRFRGREISGDFLDRQEIAGRLPVQLQAAAAFLEQHLASPARVVGLERQEVGIPANQLRVPLAVLREVLVNALVHRDYRASSQTCVFVFDDRVEVINPGVLLNRLTIENICIGGIKQFRNPLIASMANRLQGRESYGMGIPEMIRQMEQSGLRPPEFSLPGGHFRVVLRLESVGEP